MRNSRLVFTTVFMAGALLHCSSSGEDSLGGNSLRSGGASGTNQNAGGSVGTGASAGTNSGAGATAGTGSSEDASGNSVGGADGRDGSDAIGGSGGSDAIGGSGGSDAIGGSGGAAGGEVGGHSGACTGDIEVIADVQAFGDAFSATATAPIDVHTDGATVYWTVYGVGITTVPKSGGAPTVVLPGAVRYFGDDGQFIYGAVGDPSAASLRRVPKGGGAVQTLTDGVDITNEIASGVDATSLHWLTTSPPAKPTVSTLAKDGSGGVTVQSLPSNFGYPADDQPKVQVVSTYRDDSFYVGAGDSNGTDGSVRRESAVDASDMFLGSYKDLIPWSIAVDDDIYVVDMSSSYLLRFPIAGGSATMVARPLFGFGLGEYNPVPLAPDGDYVYYGDVSQTAGPDGFVRSQLSRVSKKGGAPTVLVGQLDLEFQSNDLAVDAGVLYWVDRNRGKVFRRDCH